MQIIHPVSSKVCRAYTGKPVCAVLLDGRKVYGYLQCIQGKKLILTDQPISAQTSLKKNSKKAITSAYIPYPPYGFFPGGRLVLNLAFIAFLFAVPFIW